MKFVGTLNEINYLNPYVTNGFSQLSYGRAQFHFHVNQWRSLFNLFMNFLQANRRAPDGKPHSVASNLGLYCLPMSHKKDARFITILPEGLQPLKLYRVIHFVALVLRNDE